MAAPRRDMLGRWGRDRRGATAVEFALIGPIFTLLVLGCIEFGIELLTQQTLDNATESAARQVQIGAITTQSDFVTAVCKNASSLVANCAGQLQVYVASGATFASLTPATVSASGGLSNTGFTAPSTSQALLVQTGYVRAYDVAWFTKMLGSTPTLISTTTALTEPASS